MPDDAYMIHWLVQSVPSHYLNNADDSVVNVSLRTKFYDIGIKIQHIYLDEIYNGNIVCKISAIVSRSQRVNNYPAFGVAKVIRNTFKNVRTRNMYVRAVWMYKRQSKQCCFLTIFIALKIISPCFLAVHTFWRVFDRVSISIVVMSPCVSVFVVTSLALSMTALREGGLSRLEQIIACSSANFNTLNSSSA